MALEAVTPRELTDGERTPRQRTGRGHRTAAAWSSRAGYTQGPRPRLRGPWALIFASWCVCLAVDEFPPQVLAPKGALGGPEKARGHLAGQIPAGPARASPIGGVLVGGTRGVRIPGIYSLSRRALAPWSAWLWIGPRSSEHQIVISFLSLPFSLCRPSSLFSILHCIYLLTRVLCKSLSVGPTFPPPLP